MVQFAVLGEMGKREVEMLHVEVVANVPVELLG
jgi:hypothetical protein